jgi:hypothetical protein
MVVVLRIVSGLLLFFRTLLEWVSVRGSVSCVFAPFFGFMLFVG